MTRIIIVTAICVLVLHNPISAQTANGVMIIPTSSQIDTGWMAQRDKEILNAMNVKYTKPNGFREDQRSECFEKTWRLRAAFTCLSNRLVSDDGEIVIYAPIHKIMSERDSIEINRIFSGSIKSLNHFHIGNLKAQIKNLNSEPASKNWKDNVDYYLPQDTKSTFNADTALSYSSVLKEADSYENKYRNVYSLFLQKKNRGFLNVIVFYSDKGKRTFEKYKRDIEHMFQYQD